MQFQKNNIIYKIDTRNIPMSESRFQNTTAGPRQRLLRQNAGVKYQQLKPYLIKKTSSLHKGIEYLVRTYNNADESIWIPVDLITGNRLSLTPINKMNLKRQLMKKKPSLKIQSFYQLPTKNIENKRRIFGFHNNNNASELAALFLQLGGVPRRLTRGRPRRGIGIGWYD